MRKDLRKYFHVFLFSFLIANAISCFFILMIVIESDLSLLSQGSSMKCTLCKQEIKDYSPEFNHLKIDETHSAEICGDCVRKFVKWQQGIYAKLFPTKALKRRFGKT
jgi:hypothetical protein